MNKTKIVIILTVIIALGIGGYVFNKHTNELVTSSMEKYIAEKYDSMNISLENVHYSLSFGNYIGLAYVDKDENEYFTIVSDKKGNIVKDYYSDFFNEDGSYIFENSQQ